jgi:hypothetical protein
LRLPKSDTFASPVILNKINPDGLEGSADSRFIREGNWDLPVNNLSSTDGCHASL